MPSLDTDMALIGIDSVRILNRRCSRGGVFRVQSNQIYSFDFYITNVRAALQWSIIDLSFDLDNDSRDQSNQCLAMV